MEETLNQPQKSKKLTKMQIVGIVCVAVAATLLVAALVTVFVVNFSRIIPSKVKFVDGGGQVYVQTNANDTYFGYRFKFESDGQSYTFDSDSALMRVDNLSNLIAGKTYNVSVCYKGEVEGGNSDYSQPVQWQFYKYLDTPVLSLSNNGITWDQINGADYYYVYYSTSILERLKVTSNSVDFSSLPVGPHVVMVVACSNYDYLKPSQKAGNLNNPVVVRHNLLPLTSAIIRGTVIEVVAKEAIDQLEISIGDKSYLVGGLTQHENSYVYSKDIASILSGSQVITVKPSSSNPYESYSGAAIEVTFSA